jgi:hypothetical protein
MGREQLLVKLVGGKFLGADGSLLDTSDAGVVMQALNERKEMLSAKAEQVLAQQARAQGDPEAEQALGERLAKLNDKLQNLDTDPKVSGRYIFVMNAAGDVFAGKSIVGVVHHSSFLAGGAVAAAGEISVQNGALQLVTNVSGHYRPGPMFLWQAVKQIVEAGVDASSVRVQCMGVPKVFKTAADFLSRLDPSDPRAFDTPYALERLKRPV